MSRQRRPSTGPRTTVRITYADEDLKDVVLSYPKVYTQLPELIPLGLRHVLSTTRPVLSPEVEQLWRSCKKAVDQGAVLRALRPGDRVAVELEAAELVWELGDTGWTQTCHHVRP